VRPLSRGRSQRRRRRRALILAPAAAALPLPQQLVAAEWTGRSHHRTCLALLQQRLSRRPVFRLVVCILVSLRAGRWTVELRQVHHEAHLRVARAALGLLTALNIRARGLRPAAGSGRRARLRREDATHGNRWGRSHRRDAPMWLLLRRRRWRLEHACGRWRARRHRPISSHQLSHAVPHHATRTATAPDAAAIGHRRCREELLVRVQLVVGHGGARAGALRSSHTTNHAASSSCSASRRRRRCCCCGAHAATRCGAHGVCPRRRRRRGHLGPRLSPCGAWAVDGRRHCPAPHLARRRRRRGCIRGRVPHAVVRRRCLRERARVTVRAGMSGGCKGEVRG
jgi:hypothetical protein